MSTRERLAVVAAFAGAASCLVRMQSSEHALRVQESNAKGRETLPPIHHHASIHWPQSHGMAWPGLPSAAMAGAAGACAGAGAIAAIIAAGSSLPFAAHLAPCLPASLLPYATKCAGMRYNTATTTTKTGPSCCDTRRPLFAAAMDASALQRSVPE
ncbi:hypothetical protein COCCADRAFT_3163 [Bipolaris zeicola 26-R-13]|uniref:Uncharacterized protein n=1 Tax=Cochliobolus carbonum (strain 26-R-13) TaxID=930089 RepID=W6Y7M6_COCC2|nr:uncharacterized protein COCCADRAFT_3163 [Bipolaris zeicola 26-R-13]EUC35627.1 hypothetical protein COCCADRAFT_3163 [Bipolaris zeicola 26-R-13]